VSTATRGALALSTRSPTEPSGFAGLCLPKATWFIQGWRLDGKRIALTLLVPQREEPMFQHIKELQFDARVSMRLRQSMGFNNAASAANASPRRGQIDGHIE